MRGKVIHDGATREEMEAYASTLDPSRKGTGQAPHASATESATAGDSPCQSDWIVVDCFWCATSNCVNPRWHTAICRNCHGPFTY